MTRPSLAALLRTLLALSLLLGGTFAQGEGSEAPAVTASAEVGTGDADAETGMLADLDGALGDLNGKLFGVIFFDVGLGQLDFQIPLAVVVLILGALFFTLRMGLVQLRCFKHAIDVTRGKYDDPDDEGEVSHSQALWTALSATVGLGNIGGVAIAVTVGGPGATFWMIVAGFLGMASKFAECTLGQMYRQVRPDGRVMGGAMYYLSSGFRDLGMTGVGRILGGFFAICCIGASFGGGNAFQVSQSLGAISQTFEAVDAHRWVYGAVMAVLVGTVILGGIQSIAKTAERVVPTMCIIYMLAALTILALKIGEVPAAIGTIVSSAFNPAAVAGGGLGVLLIGFQRAAFSNEAGIGSAAIAHSAAKTPYAVREGIVALLEPFIDTILVCTTTALVIVVTNAYSADAWTANGGSGEVGEQIGALIESGNGAALTSVAMGQTLSFFPLILAVATFLFAFSTMISWSYYGERCWAYLFGDSSSVVYRLIFVLIAFLASIVSASNVIDFSDVLLFSMAFPNILGVVLLSGKVKQKLDEYLGKLSAGELPTYK